jgi:hypothetical protein
MDAAVRLAAVVGHEPEPWRSLLRLILRECLADQVRLTDVTAAELVLQHRVHAHRSHLNRLGAMVARPQALGRVPHVRVQPIGAHPRAWRRPERLGDLLLRLGR